MKATYLEPEIVTRKGKPVSVILPIKDYEELLERAEDAEDVASLKQARRKKLQYRQSDYKEEAVHGISSTNLIVEKVFKGNLKVGEKMTFAQGGGADCIWTFDEEDIGKQFLFYLRSFKEAPGVWIAGTCSRSRNLEYATDDLLYLNNMAKQRGKSRISGTLSFYQSSPVENGEAIYKTLSGRKVRIVGKNKSYEVPTNKDGVYEIYNLPAGDYEIEPEVPVGWKLGRFGARRSQSERGKEAEENKNNAAKKPQRTNSFAIVLGVGKHAYVDFAYDVDNAIRGTVFDTQGNPLNGVCVHLIPAQGKKAQYFYEGDCTDEEGAFALDDIPVGSYVLVINEDGKISSDEPFPTFYYPNTLEREKAAVITIGEGETIAGLSVHAPSVEETITVTGTFLYADGKPVVAESVEFEPEKAAANVEGEVQELTDAQGRFSIKILKGLKGQLYGTMYTYLGEFENCPKIEKAIKKTGNDNAELKTPPLQVIADSNRYDVELKFPFPGCKKARE